MEYQLFMAKGSVGGGRSGGFSSRSITSTSSKSSTTSKSTSGKTVTGSSTTKTTTTATGKAATQKPAGNYKSSQVVQDPSSYKFRDGYSAPAGSVVYVNDSRSSALDWLPWIYLMHHDGSQQTTVVQPDGKEVKTVQEGSDGMYVFNWIMMIVLVAAAIGGIIWGVNRWAQKRGY